MRTSQENLGSQVSQNKLIELAHQIEREQSEWIEARMKEIVPADIYKAAHTQTFESQSKAFDWLQSNGFWFDRRRSSDEPKVVGLDGLPAAIEAQMKPSSIELRLMKGDQLVARHITEIHNGYN